MTMVFFLKTFRDTSGDNFRDTSGDNSSDQSSLSFPDLLMNNEETLDWFETAADQVFFPL